jgi:ABC-type uncharacterized transport system permease subunit
MIALNWKPTPRELRQFAAIFMVFFAIVGGLVLRRTGSLPAAALIWVPAALIGVAGLAIPAVIRPVFIGMSIAAYPIGWVVSHVLMFAIWYLVVTPIGLAMRASGRDPLARAFDRTAMTYWVRRREARPERYLRQY